MVAVLLMTILLGSVPFGSGLLLLRLRGLRAVDQLLRIRHVALRRRDLSEGILRPGIGMAQHARNIFGRSHTFYFI